MSTDRDNFLSTVRHERPGRILYYANFTPDLKKRVIEHIGSEDIGEHYGFMKKTFLHPHRPEDLDPISYDRYYKDEDLPEGTHYSPVGVARVPSGFYHFFGYVSPLRNAERLEDIENYPLPDYQKWETLHYEETVKEARERGDIVVGNVGHMYEWAWQIRGYEQFLMDLMQRPEWAECLLDRIMEGARFKAITAARAGADYLHCGDDVANQEAMMFSKPVWEEFMHSRWEKLWAEVKEINPDCRIWYHSDGDIEDIAGDLVDGGVDIMNPLQPEALDVDTVYDRYGDRVTFDGTIGTQSTMPHGSPDDVGSRVKGVIDKYGQNGGLIVSPTHVLEPEVPLENIDAMVEACREYGTFE